MWEFFIIHHPLTLVPEVYFSSPLRNENNKNKPLEPGYHPLYFLQNEDEVYEKVSKILTVYERNCKAGY
jgi:hypothetical protein